MKGKSKAKQKLIDALDRIIRGCPVRTDAKLSPSNVAREAEVGRATLYRFPEILEDITRAQNNFSATKLTHQVETIKRLKLELGKLHREENAKAREYKEIALRCAQHIQALSLVLRIRDGQLAERDKIIADLRVTLRRSGNLPSVFTGEHDVSNQKPRE